jgi:hypothetical protein
MCKTIVAIHQPNFFPWLGYFAKLARADAFVFLTGADYPKSGSSMSSYVNRVQVDVGGKSQWWGCPVKRENGPQPISSVCISDPDWSRKKLRTLEQNYARAPHFKDLWEPIRALIQRPATGIAEYNMANIREISAWLGLKAEFMLDADFGEIGTSTERLVNIVSRVGGDVYISGKGGDKYQDKALFDQAGISLTHTNFVPRPYPQGGGDFLPGLSILDALLQCGVEGTHALLAT